jgi:flagellar biosynthesis anti-sigma factor FlgM
MDSIKGNPDMAMAAAVKAARNSPAAGKPIAANLPGAIGGGREPLAAAGARGLVKDMAAQPPIAVERVAVLKAAVEAGSYSVDTGRLADAMIASEKAGR